MIELSTIIYILVLIVLISLVLSSIVKWFIEGDTFDCAYKDEHSNTDEAGKP
jgi:flagellar basal body-associated protein FliL